MSANLATETRTAGGKKIGTFDLCIRCPSQSRCCSRVKNGGGIEPPIVREEEVRVIECQTGKPATTFSEQRSSVDSIRWMRPGAEGCHFYQDGKCGIYAIRPIDCRLFPYDVRENKAGQLVLIAYTSLCPERFDVSRYREHAKTLLDLLGDDILAYCRALTPGMDEQPHVVLGTIEEVLRTES